MGRGGREGRGVEWREGREGTKRGREGGREGGRERGGREGGEVSH